MKIIETQKGKFIYSEITGNTLKKVPEGKSDEYIDEWYSKLSFNKRLKTKLKSIKKREPYVFELIAKNEVLGTRQVNTRDGIRFELVYVDGIRIKINETLFLAHENKLPTVNLNY